jgi:hypothetical protein
MLLGPVSAHGANFLELIMQVLASQMQFETQELLKERYSNFFRPSLNTSLLDHTVILEIASSAWIYSSDNE